MNTDFNQDLSLANVCAGDLERDFQKMYPDLVAALKEGNKASVSITIEMGKVPNTTTMINMSYSITPKFPARKKAGVCQIADKGKLRTERPLEPVKTLSLFDKEAK